MLFFIDKFLGNKRIKSHNLSELLLFLIFIMGFVFTIPHLAEAKTGKLSIADLILLKQVGYNEKQIIQEIDKMKLRGQFHLSTLDILKLKKAGFSIVLIRLMRSKKAHSSPTNPITLAELKGWLILHKKESWISQKLQRRNIVHSEFNMLAILSLNKMGIPIKLLRLIHKLKQNAPKPIIKHQPLSNKKPSTTKKNFPDIPSFPGIPSSFFEPVKKKTNKPRVIVQLKKGVRRWGIQSKERPLTERERRLVKRRGFRVPRPISGIYQHIGKQFLLSIPKNWNIYEDTNPEQGLFVVYITPQQNRQICKITKSITISLRYLDRQSSFVRNLSLLQISRRILQEYFSMENNIMEFDKLKLSDFNGKRAFEVILDGKERLSSQKLRRKLFLVRKENIIYHISYFAPPKEFKSFGITAQNVLKEFIFTDEDKFRGKKRLIRAQTVQSLIQKNKKGVVSISVAHKKKNGRTVFTASGSGFVVTSNGYVITNYHVAMNLKTGKPYKSYVLNWDNNTKLKSVHAKFVSSYFKYPQWKQLRMTDSKTGRISVRYQRQHVDIALLKIIEKGRYPTVKLNPIKNAMLGDTVVAMGFPLEGSGINKFGNDDITATTGRISRLIRMGITHTVNEVQHTAKIAGGNSGGPLFDTYTGGVIGINTWVGIFDKRLARPAMGVGYYYALPINLAWQFFPDYIDYPTGQLRYLQWFELGSKWMSSGQFKPAQRAFMRAIHLQPNFIPAYAKLSELFFNKGLQYNNDQREKYMTLARRWADKGLQKELNDPTLMKLLAQIALSKNDWNTSRYLIKKMKIHSPSYWGVYYLNALMLLRQRKLKQALASAEKVIRFVGKLRPTGYILKGLILYSANRHFEGQQAYRQALKIAPNNLEAKIGEALGYLYLKQYKDAQNYLKRLEKKYPHAHPLYRAEMRVYTASKAYTKAWLAFQKYWRYCILQEKTPDAFSLYIAGHLAQRVLSSKYKASLVWGLWGLLLQEHTKTDYAGRASIILASKAKRNHFYGLLYGILKMGRQMSENKKLKARINRIYRRLRPRGLSRKALLFILFRTAPRWKPKLIRQLFAITPSLLDLQTARYLIKRGVPTKLVLFMYRLSLKRRKRGLKTYQKRPRSHRRKRGLSRTSAGTQRDVISIKRTIRFLIKALYQGDLDLWMSAYEPTISRSYKHRKLFQALYTGLNKGLFVYYPLKRTHIRWYRHPRYGRIAHFYFKARSGRKRISLYYWKLRKYGTRWVVY